ncbi:glycoside hydrolase family 13 protein [Acidicapsa ligni]|uniref:glycoside hydrolase family 13 protein n=1 Tax=Acidicapsa ligni TaxID=542300 RepID=UPI0021DFD789|nr:alpha-glucosidase [Acidicapsa ligni]
MNQKNLTAGLALGLSSVLTLGLAALPGMGQTPHPAPSAMHTSSTDLENWWKNAVIYEIYPRSFQDSNGDGIGDLNGITSRLDYLQKLGVEAIWLSPIYPSPQVDFGYDISDYEGIDPQYGTMADFDRLVAEAKKRDIRIVMDMVMNHSSDKHAWFEESRSSRKNPKRNWYVWKDGKGETATSKGEPPNNWQSDFGHSAWEWDEKTRQYYYHKFYIQQPDFNWNNPEVEKAFDGILKFWMNKGVAGFRFDAITTLFEDPNWIDDKELLDKDGKTYLNDYGDVSLDDARTNNLPEVNRVVEHVRKVEDSVKPNVFPGRRVMIGETYVPTIKDLLAMYGTTDKPEFQLPMDTQVGFINKLDVATFRSKLNDVETKIDGNIPLLVFDNHDNARIDARYGDGVHDTAITRVISTMLFASRGSALFYNGAEIGMKTTPPTRKEDVKDPVGLTGWPKNKGRDGERTPMQWDDSTYAGFSTAAPWLPVPSNKDTINVKSEEADPDSLLNWYESLIRLKKTNPVFIHGENVMLDTENTKVLSWLRKEPGKQAVVVSVNFTAEPQTVNLGATSASETPGHHAKTLLKSPGVADPESLENVQLPPFGVYIGEVE